MLAASKTLVMRSGNLHSTCTKVSFTDYEMLLVLQLVILAHGLTIFQAWLTIYIFIYTYTYVYY